MALPVRILSRSLLNYIVWWTIIVVGSLVKAGALRHAGDGGKHGRISCCRWIRVADAFKTLKIELIWVLADIAQQLLPLLVFLSPLSYIIDR